VDGLDQAVPTRGEVDHGVAHERRGDLPMLMTAHAVGDQKQAK